MAHHSHDEDDEIEQHLILRIDHAITSTQGDRPQTAVIKEIQDVLNILSLKTNANPKVAKEWPSLRRENLYYLNNLFTEWQMTKRLAATSPFKSAAEGGQDNNNNKSDENIKKNLKKMKKVLTGDHSEGSVTQHPPNFVDDDEKEERKRHPIFERHKGDVYRWSSRYGPRKVHGLDHLVMAMERDLVMRKLDDPFKVFGITGVAGIGKTTLCQQIFNLESVKKHFCPRIWVCLSKQPKDRDEYKEEVVVRILKCLGVEVEIIENAAAKGSDGLKRLILLLRLQLTGRRYLLVLDDAWCDIKDDKFFSHLTQKEQMDENWGHELAYALPKGCDGTIICSSRSQNLLKRMLGKEASLTVMKRQTDAIIYEIFKDNVKGYDEDEREFPEDLTLLKKEILKKCDGIPLAATLLAKIAREGLPVIRQGAVAGGGHESITPASDGGGR